MQPLFIAVSTSCHAGPGLAGHPRCVRVGNDYDKTRLYTPISSKTTALLWYARHHSVQRGRSNPPRRGDQGSPPSQTILEIRARRGGVSIQGSPIWAVPGGCSSLPSATDGNLHSQLPRRLAHSGPVRGSFNIAQDPPQPLMFPGAQGQLCQEHTVNQPVSIVPGHSYRPHGHDDSALCGFLQGRDRPSTQSFPENAGPYCSSFASTSAGSASHATHPVLAETEGSIRGLASQTSTRNGDSGLCISPGPLEGTPLAKARHYLRHGAQKEGCHDRCFQQGLGSAV